jgi:pyruvate formate lyase activating enzyme
MMSYQTTSLRIGGFIPFSLMEYPGYISCVIYTQGCNFKCSYCHNKHLMSKQLHTEYENKYDEQYVLNYISKHSRILTGIVITGGEPTIHTDALVSFIERIKQINPNLNIKIETNGSKPVVISRLINLNLINFIQMDVKSPFKRDEYDLYRKVCGNPSEFKFEINEIEKSIDIIKKCSTISHEFRTTLCSQFLNETQVSDIEEIVRESIKVNTCACLQCLMIT